MQADEQKIRTFIQEQVPSLNICSLNLIGMGADHIIADVNDEWIFRFLAKESQVANLEREGKLLDWLQKKAKVAIPHIEYRGSNPPFVAYRKLKGDLLDRQGYLNLTPLQRHEMAETLADFFTLLHHIPLEEAKQWGYQPIDPSYVFLPEGHRFKIMVDEANDVVKHRHAGPPVLLHNDLHGENMVYDRATGKITGIFDFSDAGLGDYAIDFARLFSVHPDLALEVISIYAKQNHLPPFAKAAAADYVLRRAASLKRAEDRKDAAREAYLTDILDKFTPVWKSINAIGK